MHGFKQGIKRLRIGGAPSLIGDTPFVVAEWKRTTFKPPAPGPPPALLSSLGWAVLALGLSLLTAHRRQVSS
jgi:hypothetical protein